MVPSELRARSLAVEGDVLHVCAMELLGSAQVVVLRIRLAEHLRGTGCFRSAAGRTIVRVLASDRLLSTAPDGAPPTDSQSEAPPVIRRAELVAFALGGLLIIGVVAVLYFAKAFFLPVVMAFVVGTMLSPAANFLTRYRIPRSVGAVLIVVTVTAA